MNDRALWRRVFRNTFTYYSRLNFSRTKDPDDLVEMQRRSIRDSILDQGDIPQEEKLDVYISLCNKFPYASKKTKKQWRRAIGA